MKNKTLLMLQSIAAGLQLIAGASTLGDIIPEEKYVGLFVLLVGAFQVGLATWVQGLHTTPSEQPVVIAQKGSDVSIDVTSSGTGSPTTTFGKHESK